METLPINESHLKSPQNQSISNNKAAPEQLSFESLMEAEDNSAKLALIPYTDYHLINAKEFTFPKRRFFILSIVVHIVFAVYALTIVVEKLKKNELVEVSYVSQASPPISQTNYSQPEPPAEITREPEIVKTEPVVVTKSVVKSAAKADSKKAATKLNSAPHSVIKTTALAPTTKVKSFSQTFKAEPLATVSDIEVPVLTSNANEEISNPNLKDIENDFDKIDNDQNEKLLAVTQDDSKMLEDSISELNDTSKNVADEPSHLEALAAERLQYLKEQKSKLKKASAASVGPAITQSAIPTGKFNSAGTENQRSETPSGIVGLGSQSGGIVRKLEDLRQKPGNPRPSYDVSDRMNGLSGTIIVNAYVTKEGNLTLFRLIQSTGHRNLDRKTLAALKDWKFYPGQEGWVELPFKWDLKGGVQQKPTLLQRR